MRSAVSEICEEAGEVRLALLSPAEAGDFAAEILRLNAAIDRLREVQTHVEMAPPVEHERAELQRDLRALREDVARLAKIAGHGEAFWRGWARMIGLDSGGYTPLGLPAELGDRPAVATRVLG